MVTMTEVNLSRRRRGGAVGLLGTFICHTLQIKDSENLHVPVFPPANACWLIDFDLKGKNA